MLRYAIPAGLAALGALGAVALARAAAGLPTALGAPRARMYAAAERAAAGGSAHAAGGLFRNTLPDTPPDGLPGVPPRAGPLTVLWAMATRGPVGLPPGPVPLVAEPPPATAGELALTWYGHSSVLLEVDGCRVLADPVWAERVSPSPTVGPRRLHPVPVPLSAVPPVDAVVISHDHYDHLDLPTVRALVRSGSAPFVVPLGIGEHLRGWGVPAERVVELDWGRSVRVGPLTLTCTEARHFSGRRLRRNTTLWASWVVAGPRHRVFFGGDTGYTPAFADLGAAHGPFDLTVLPVGAYADLWPLVHMTPEEAVRAHRDLTGGGPLVPVHWATFNLGFHGWDEPVRRLCAAAAAAGVAVAVPRPGERFDPTVPQAAADWWARVGPLSGPPPDDGAR